MNIQTQPPSQARHQLLEPVLSARRGVYRRTTGFSQHTRVAGPTVAGNPVGVITHVLSEEELNALRCPRCVRGQVEDRDCAHCVGTGFDPAQVDIEGLRRPESQS